MRFLPACLFLLCAFAQEPAPGDLKLFQPLPANFDVKESPGTQALVELGRMLYFETRLSLNQKISCNTCHPLDKFGVDNEPTSLGHDGRRGDRNSPTTMNAAGHFVQFWDGSARTIEDQAKGPVTNPVEMGMPGEKAVVDVLRSIPGYKDLFARAFPAQAEPITWDNYARAVGAFERRLVTPSRWDAYLKGKPDALTAAEKSGFNTFMKAGCAACHNGINLGGSAYQKVGLVKPYPDQSDPGRYKVTHKDWDTMVFKTPGLRNVTKTAPYFHNGKVPTITEAVAQMGVYQLGKQLSEDEVRAIVTFLDTLTGEAPKSLTAPPQLPPSGPATPKAKESD